MPDPAVVDTNILVSALLKPGGLPGKVATAIVHGRLQPVVCSAIIAEYGAVLRRSRFGFSRDDVIDFVALVAAQAKWVHITEYDNAIAMPDPSDWPFAACAIAAGCPLITGNVRHFPGRLGIEVLTARAWLERIPGLPSRR